MTPYEYILRSHPEGPKLSFFTVWLYGWSKDAAVKVMRALTFKALYQRDIHLMNECRKSNDMRLWSNWNKNATIYGQKYLEYLAELKQLEAMQ